MRNISQHAEWLSLIEVSGPFLTVSMLEKAFPQGLESVTTPRRQRLRAAYEEWCDAIDEGDPMLVQLHQEWIRLVLMELLEYDKTVMVEDGSTYHSPDHSVRFSSSLVIKSEGDERPRLLVSIQPPKTELGKVRSGDTWAASITERMILLCRETGVRVGLITNGDHWILVNAPIGSTSSHVSWYARLWFQEPVTLKAFQSLLGVRRCFGPVEDRLETLLEESLKDLDEVTDTLGEQVRRAVEVLVQCLDKADEDRNRELLRNVSTGELYEAGLTVMMRLVFVLCAEERELLLLGDPVYDQCYAVSTLRVQLTEDSNSHGPEVLDRRYDAWSRLLAVFRAIYSGVEHESLRMPAFGGSLFDPDRFPFLEGRIKGSRWRDEATIPLPIDNRTVLMLLDALQVLEQHGGALLLSYRALDVEQIGHVYEGLLEHTVARVPQITLGLIGSSKASNPNLPLVEIESALMDGEQSLLNLLEVTQRSKSAIRNALARSVDDDVSVLILSVCGGDTVMAKRILPYANLLRTDAWGYPIVYHENALIVTLGSDRRETGTHYTPKSMTERVVSNTLEPVVYQGPAEGKPREQWLLKSPTELLELKVCDPAMGSGAFLVQACRWLAERLVDSWGMEEACGKVITVNGEVREKSDGSELIPIQLDERLIIARRLVAERCLYGVDINPLAVELAKLSLWLVTWAKGHPFGFLDHNLRQGDSLLGIHRLDQLTTFRINPEDNPKQLRMFALNIEKVVAEAIEICKNLRSIPVRDIRDVEIMARLNKEVRSKLDATKLVADAMIGEGLRSGGNERELNTVLEALSTHVDYYLNGNGENGEHISRLAQEALAVKLSPGRPLRKPFHWPLEFPEVFVQENGGFDVIVGNPPFLGNRLWKSMLGATFQVQAKMILHKAPGKVDLCVIFHRRVTDLLRPGGMYGMLATNNIAEGSAIAVGLGEIVKKGTIVFAEKGVSWPGKAAVEVAIVCFYKGQFIGPKYASGETCDLIGSRLKPEAAEKWEAHVLKNPIFSFEGVHNGKGLAFLIGSDNPWFDKLKNEKKSILKPYITGNDITSYALNKIERWALDIGDRSLEEIRDSYPVAYKFLVEIVQLTRTIEELHSYKGLYQRWWQFWNNRAKLMNRLRGYETCIVFSKVTTYPICMLAPSEWIYTNKVLLIGNERSDLFPVCLSTFFCSWLEDYSGGRLRGWLTLSIRESVEKFPLPKVMVKQDSINAAARFNASAVQWCFKNNTGLTGIMNAINSPDCEDSVIRELRKYLVTIDQYVAEAYGWDDLDMTRNFYRLEGRPESNGTRFTISESTRKDIVQRLLELNRKIYMDESK